MNLLEVNNLKIDFETPEGLVKAVNDVSLNLANNESLAIVGESGSGKTQLVFSILGLLAKNATATGSIKYEDQEILNLPDERMNKIRSNKISMIFQDPMSSLNPVLKIGKQVNESLIYHKKYSQKSALKKTLNLLKKTKIPSPEQGVNNYPHQF